MKIFVTGANGFIGRAFCATAQQRGHEVLGLCRTAADDLPCVTAIGSLEDIPWKSIEAFQPEAALHLAWIATPGVYLNSPDNDLLVTQSQQLVRGLAERGVRHFAGTGTCIEYAASTEPMGEGTAPLNATFPYSMAKTAFSKWLAETAPCLNFEASWFRIFYPYGPGEHPNRLPSMIIRKLAARESMELRTPDSIKDYIYVDDLAQAVCIALENRAIGAINLGSGHGVLISDLAKMIAEILGVDPQLVQRAAVPAADPWPVQIAVTSRMQSLGWRAETDLKAGLARLIDQLSITRS